MQNQKCCYCESEIPESGHSKAVEHFRPQAIFPSKRNEWKNLLLACAQCNGHKSDKFPVAVLGSNNTVKVLQARQEESGRPAILDPCDSSADPEDHLDFVFGLNDPLLGLVVGIDRNGRRSALGQRTITVVGLDSAYFRGKYATFITSMYREFTRILDAANTKNSNGVRESRRQFEQWMAAGNEFAGVARAFVRSNDQLTKLGVKVPDGNQ